jgi:hypothetical protein
MYKSNTLPVYLAYSLTLKIDAVCSSETSVTFHGATRCHIPEDEDSHDMRTSYPTHNVCLFQTDVLTEFKSVRLYITQ